MVCTNFVDNHSGVIFQDLGANVCRISKLQHKIASES